MLREKNVRLDVRFIAVLHLAAHGYSTSSVSLKYKNLNFNKTFNSKQKSNPLKCKGNEYISPIFYTIFVQN